MEQLPQVTIGVPNYNYAHYVLDTLKSIASQTYPNIELIIVDDFSTDNSIQIIEDWIGKYSGKLKIKFIKNKVNIGLTKVCNIILNNASGKYFQTLDADDLILPDKIARQVIAMQASVNTAFIYSNVQIIDYKGNIIETDYLGRIGYDKKNMPQGNIFEKLFEFNFVPLPSVLVNTEYAKKVGGFNEALQVQDYYLWLKLSENYEAIYIPEITAFYREHASSMSNSASTNPKSTDSVLNIKYSYYHFCNEGIRRIIRKNINLSGAYLYRSNFPSAGKWLRINLLLNPGFKSLVYFTANKLGIPCSVLDKYKMKFRTGHTLKV
jgi:glycosyltransferase involved in cell wall biosynthesis